MNKRVRRAGSCSSVGEIFSYRQMHTTWGQTWSSFKVELTRCECEWSVTWKQKKSRQSSLQNKHPQTDTSVLSMRVTTGYFMTRGGKNREIRCSQWIFTIMAKINNECSCESKQMLTAHTLVLSFHTSLTLSSSLPYKQMLSLTLPRAPSMFFSVCSIHSDTDTRIMSSCCMCVCCYGILMLFNLPVMHINSWHNTFFKLKS